MKYLAHSYNRLFFLLILLLAMIFSCTDGNLFALVSEGLFGAN